MSSLRVRAQNKLLNKFGAAKPSKNVQFDTAHANFERTQAGVAGLDAALRGFIISMKGFHISAQVLFGAIEAMGGTPESSPEMKQMVAELKNAFVHVDGNLLNDSVKRFESRVLRPTSGWIGRAHTLKHQVGTFQDEKMMYDHYTRKVLSLREARDKRSAGGKAEKPKDVEKLVRNEQKLAHSTNTYSKISESTVTNLREFVNTREETLAPLLQRVLEFRVTYAAQVAAESKLFEKMVKHESAFDGVIGMLESFATQLGGSSHVASEPNAHNSHQFDSTTHHQTPSHTATFSPEPQVQALSFESFVGEAPPLVRQDDLDGWIPPPPPPPIPVPLATTILDSFTVSPPASSYLTAPVMPLPVQSPPISPSSSFTPWDDIPAATTKPATSDPARFHTLPIQGPTATPASSTGWDAFNNLGSADFQNLHQSAMH